MMNNNDLLHLFSCCLRQKQKNRISDLPFNDPSNFYIYLGINKLKISNSKRLIIVDFGSSYGQNSIETMKLILEYLKQIHKFRKTPLIIHNDISTNNWTNFFEKLSLNTSYHSLVNVRSFYEQCLPNNSLSIGYSSASLHYLSRKPCNIINHCYIHFAEEYELERFKQQAKNDLNLFIEHRSKELKKGGILILNIPSTNQNGDMGFNQYFDLIYQSAKLFLSKEELIDFTLPFYLRSLSECNDQELFTRCSLKLIKIELIHLKSLIFSQYKNNQITFNQFSKSLLILMQSGIESIFKKTLEIHQRTNEEINQISTKFWSLFEEKIKKEIHPDNVNTYATYLILQKK